MGIFDNNKTANEEQVPFLTIEKIGTPRNDFPGYVGMQITVGAEPVTVHSLGRIFIYGNTERHVLKIIDGRTGADVRGGSVTVCGGENLQFTYEDLPRPIILEKNKVYYIVSEEHRDGDLWYHSDTEISTTSVAHVDGAIYFWGRWNLEAKDNGAFVPVNFK